MIPLVPKGLGFVPIIVGALSLLAQKKQQEAGMDTSGAAYQASQEAIATGAGVPANVLFTANDKIFLQKLWPTIRVAANFGDINWSALGYKSGPLLSRGAIFAVTNLWPQIRTAAAFDHINWQVHAIPTEQARQYVNIAPVNLLDPVLQAGSQKTLVAMGLAATAVLAGLFLLRR